MRTQILQNSKILIVDDQEANVALLRQILEHYGFAHLHSFTDPRSVAPLFDEINPDLVLLDLQMPHIDGLSLLKQLRSRIPEDTYLPFLILTADLSNRSKQEALALGAKDFLTKPFDQMEVVLRIYNLLETRLLHLELHRHNRTLEDKVRERTTTLEAMQRELVRKNGELLLALAKASEAAELKSQFLHNINHEIRTPINGILGMINLLSESENDAGRSEDIEMLKSSADWLVTLMNDILDISALDAGTLRVECRSFDLHLLLEEVSSVYRSRVEAKGLKFVATVPPTIPRLIGGDPLRLRQILDQLLGNALKFTEIGQVSLSVECLQETSDRLSTKFVVEDTGIGITEEQCTRLFEVFVQGNGSSSRKYGGAGIGLALSKQLVALLGGEIGVDSRPSGGTKAWFTAALERLPMENISQAGGQVIPQHS
jgi:signal transduction histidine kinase